MSCFGKTFSLGCFALCVLQSTISAVIVLNDQASNDLSIDTSWTLLKWADADGFRRSWDINDTFRTPGVNDTFRIVVPLGMTGIVEVTDIAWDNDRYSLLDVSNGTVGLTSIPADFVLTDAINNGVLPNMVTLEGSPSVTFADTSNGGASNWSTGQFLFPTANTYDLNLDWVDDGLDNGSLGGVGIRFRTIPEPSSALLLLAALGMSVARRHRK